MIQPDELKKDTPLLWSTGRGTDVWALFCACIAGDLAAVRRLIEIDPSLVQCQYSYRTPLYFAVRENRIAVVEFLLEQQADPLSFAVGDSLLEICRDRGYAEMEQLLAANYATVQGASPAGEAVAAAIRAHDLAKMRSLLDTSPELASCGRRAIESTGPLGSDDAAGRRDRRIGGSWREYRRRSIRRSPPDSTRERRLLLSRLARCAQGLADEADRCNCAGLRARGAYCGICTASHIGDLGRVHELLEEDPALANRLADYTTYYLGSGSPLKNAAANGHIEIVRLLLDHGADPNLREEGTAPHGHALYAAAANRHYEIVKLLLEHGAYPNPPVESSADALSRAIMNADQPMIDLLCSHGAARKLELLAYDGDVQTAAAVFAANPALADDPPALANAAGEGKEAFVRLMLRYQPDLPKRVVFPGWLTAAKTSELNELLFAHGMDPSQRDWLGGTAAPPVCCAREKSIARSNSSRTAPICMHATKISARRPWAMRPSSARRQWLSCCCVAGRRRTWQTIHPGLHRWLGRLAEDMARSRTC